MKRFRLLRPDEIECRIQKIYERNGVATSVAILLYKTARTDADLLDETVGSDKWENDFKLIDGTLYGGIGVDFGDGHLVWKWDAGTESNTEAEKGRASDAFKRAGSKHGIGRELYSSPKIFIEAEKCKKLKQNERSGKWECYDAFDVTKIEYDTSERIKSLEISVDGRVVFSYPKRSFPKDASPDLNAEYEPPDKPATPKEAPPICADCGKPLKKGKRLDGTVWPVEEVKAYSERAYGVCVCPDCISKRFKLEKLEEQAQALNHEDAGDRV